MAPNGVDGQDGEDGQDGIGISKSEINDSGELVITYSNGSEQNLGNIVGADGADGQDESHHNCVSIRIPTNGKFPPTTGYHGLLPGYRPQAQKDKMVQTVKMEQGLLRRQ